MTTPRLLSLVVALALGAAGLGACSTDSGGDRVTIYSGRQESLVGPLLERFAEETGISVDVRYGDSADLALLIDQEGDRTPAQVFLSQSPGATGFLDAEERLAELPADVLDRVDERFHSPDGRWVGVSGRVRTLVFNTEAVTTDELPASVLDVTDERYRGRVGVAPTNASFQDFVTGMREAIGDERTQAWLDGLVANDVQTYANNVAIVEAVARGEIDYGLVNHYYNERQLAEDPSSPTANHFFPDGDLGSMLLVTGAAILAGNEDDANAQRLVEFLLSEQAQRFFADETFEYPLAAGVEPAGDLPPVTEVVSTDVDLGELGGDLEGTKRLIEQSGLEQA